MVKEVLELAAAAPAVSAAPAVAAAAGGRPSPRPHPGKSSSPRGSKPPRRSIAARSGKDTRQVVFDLAETGLAYEPGDALGVQPINCPDTVRRDHRLSRRQGRRVRSRAPTA